MQETVTNRKMKDSGIDWIGEIPEDWDVKTFRHIFIERNEKNTPIKTEERLSLSIDKGVTLYAEKTTNLDRFKDDFTQYKLAHVGDFVLNSMNMIVGAVGVSKYYGCISPAYYTYYNKCIETAYFYEYLFRTKVMNRMLYSLGKGIYAIERGNDRVNTCRLKVSKDDLKSLKLPFPPQIEQQKIVSFLNWKCSHIDSVLEKTRASIDEYKQLKQSVITKAVTKGIRPNRPMKDSGVEWIGKIPEDWKIAQLKRFLKSNNGSEIKQEVNKDDNEAIPVYGSGGIFKYTNKFMYSGEVVMFGRKGTLGKPLYVNDTFWTVDTMYYLNNFNGLIAKYTYYLLVAFDWIPFITQTALPSIVSSQIIAQHFSIPSLKEQQEIVLYLDNKCSELDKLITKKEQLIEELETYKKSLIYEYVTGKKEVC